MLSSLFQVALGGALGAAARHLLNIGVMRLAGPGFPWGTMAVNVLGSFLMGVLVVVLARRGGMHLAPLLMTGLLGGFTTFSAYALDVATLWERGATGAAALYATASVVLSVGALFAGLWAARGVVA